MDLKPECYLGLLIFVFFIATSISQAASQDSHPDVAGISLPHNRPNPSNHRTMVLREPRGAAAPEGICPEFHYADKETLVCESCAKLCAEPRSPACLLENACRGVDGYWNCSDPLVCDVSCDSPKETDAEGRVLRRGVADCACVVRKEFGGRPCKGEKRTTCLVNIESDCQRIADDQRFRETLILVAWVPWVVLVVVVAIIVGLGYRFRRELRTKLRTQLFAAIPGGHVACAGPHDRFE